MATIEQTTSFPHTINVLKSLVWSLTLLGAIHARGQIYLEATGGIFPFDLCNCTTGAPINVGTGALAVSPNQSILGLINDSIFTISAAGNTTFLGPMPGGSNNLVCAQNGLIYSVGIDISGTFSFLSVLDPATGINTYLGDLPPGFFSGGDLFFYNSNLYMTGEYFGDAIIAQIPVNNPGATSIAFQTPNFGSTVGAVSFWEGGVQKVFIWGWENGVFGIYEFDMNSGTTVLRCPVQSVADMGAWSGLQLAPCCNNNAGNWANLSLLSACEDDPVAPQHLGNEILAPGSALSFILVADSTAALPGSILQTNATPAFTFNPAAMSVNTVYYVAAVAAPGPPGAPNWSASCKDLSFFAPVLWKALPTVAFAGAVTPACGSECLEFSLNFAGNFPIALDWGIDWGAQSLSGTFVANTPASTLTVCPTAGNPFPSGTFQLQLLAISDGECGCE